MQNSIEILENKWKDSLVQDELKWIKSFGKDLGKAYTTAENNAWIVRTLVDRKERYKFMTCANIVLVGCGMYPYSMFDVHRQYPHIKQVGVEINPSFAKVATVLVKSSPAKEAIEIVAMDGYDYDYSWLGSEDFVFISVDVVGKMIYKKVIETSKAQPLVCAPYNYTWLKNTLA